MTDTTKPVEPVAYEVEAVRHNFDGYGWLYSDNGNGSNWLSIAMQNPDAEALVPAAALDAANAEIERLKGERSVLVQSAKDVGASFRLALARAEKAEAESAALEAYGAAKASEGREAGMKEAAGIASNMHSYKSARQASEAIIAAIKENQP